MTGSIASGAGGGCEKTEVVSQCRTYRWKGHPPGVSRLGTNPSSDEDMASTAKSPSSASTSVACGNAGAVGVLGLKTAAIVEAGQREVSPVPSLMFGHV